MASFTGNASINFIRPDFVSDRVIADPAGSRPSGAADRLDGGGGADILNGGDGNDVYFVDNVGDIAEEVNNTLAGGIDTVNASVTYTLSAALENLFLLGSRDIDASGNGNDNDLRGNAGDNMLRGFGGNDTLDGGDGGDTLLGGTGRDELDGGRGADSMDGGNGDDTYHVDTRGDVAAEASNGVAGGLDIVFARADHTLGFGIENLTFEGAGNFSGGGNAEENVIRGNGGANTLDGLRGDDTLIGGGGNDVLLGGLGDDVLRGQGGADTLQSGAETDILIGGLGNDVFDFNAASHSTRGARDTIRTGDGDPFAFDLPGANVGDLIDVSGMDADEVRPGNQAFVFGGNGVGHLALIDSAGLTIVRGNTAAGGGFEFELAIEDGTIFTPVNYVAADFIL